MDPGFNPFPGSIKATRLANRALPFLPNPNLIAGPGFRFDPSPSNMVAHEEDQAEDCDFSDAVLRYINQIMMEEDMEDKACMLQESLDLQAAERSLYEAIGKKYPPSPEPNWGYPNLSFEGPIQEFPGNVYDGGYLEENQGQDEYKSVNVNTRDLQTSIFSVLSVSQCSCSSANSIITSVDGLYESPNSALQVTDLNGENQSVSLFRRGVKEASRFLPGENEFLIDFRVNSGLSMQEGKQVAVKVEKKEESELARGRKNPFRDEVDLEEERSSKLAAVFPDEVGRSVMADKILVHVPGEESMKEFEAFRDSMRKGVERNVLRTKGSGGAKGRGKRRNREQEVVDLRALLIFCAQAVAADDRRTASELIKQIRLHSSSFGDGNQRLAHYFANALEARLAGTGSQVYKGLVNKKISNADILKAHHLYLACCPFRKLSNFVANKTIKGAAVAAKSMRLHVIDFGILYGFQWPTLIQRLSMVVGGPPKLRITGIDFPQPGFRPAQRVEETGRRLAAYAEEYHVPFEYDAIAKSWDTIRVEDLKIDRDEFLVVNCLYRSKNLHDETVRAESQRDIVLNLVRKSNPDLFIHGVVNGAYNAPFFVTRFREALFHFSSMFDMLETIVPREDHERMLLETNVFGREALNVIACEGCERVERPETYKQWQVRAMRSGFLQVPFDPSIVKEAKLKVESGYHKDFVIDEDSQWLLQGWKGRTIYALSAWKPTSKV